MTNAEADELRQAIAAVEFGWTGVEYERGLILAAAKAYLAQRDSHKCPPR